MNAMDDKTDRRPQLDAAQLQALLDAVDRLTSALSLDEVLGHILAIGQELTASQAGSVILHDPKKDELFFAAATGPTAGEVKDLRIPAGKGKAGTVFARRLSIVENDLHDHFKAVDQKTHFTTRSMVCVPLVFGDKCYGVLQLLNKEVIGVARPYDKIDLELTQRLAIQATIAIRNAFLFDRMLASSGLHARAEDRRDLVALFTGQNPTPVVELASILFVDMRGFTRFCRDLGNDPARIQYYLNQFFGVLAEAVLSNGGIVNKFLGDGLLAIFRGTEAPARAVRSAFAMHERFAPLRKSWQESEAEVVSADIGYLDIGVGIASDRITIGAVGDDKVSDFTIIGGAVNLAAALERMARDGKRILCDGPTFRAVKALISEVGGPESIRLGSNDSSFQIYDLRGLGSAIKRARIFICHAHPDLARIKELVVPLLTRNGYEIFLAENSIAIGEDWDKAIEKAIRASDYFMVMISKTAMKSSPVSDEVHFAFSLEKTKGRTWIMPVVLEQAGDPAEIHWQLPRRQYKDLTSMDGIAEFEALLSRLSTGADGGLRSVEPSSLSG
jgi:class 3 adenylate cyclase